jgi:cytochrome b
MREHSKSAHLTSTSAPHNMADLRVWDLFVRVFHWSLVACVVLNQFILEEGETAHQWVGYIASALVAARVLWGFVGSTHARFSDFFPTPRSMLGHVQSMLSRRPDQHVGHNPLGAAMMLTLMTLVLSLGLTGWLQTTDWFWGDETMQEIHETLAATLIWLAGLHAASALVMGRIERVRLVRAMITGVKQRF